MQKFQKVSSLLLGLCTYLSLGCSALLFQTQECQAKLIVGFQFADGSTNKVVPQTGGVYTVNIVASTDNPLTTNLGVNSGYVGALSQLLNGSTIDGDITARSLTVGLGSFTGVLVDLNADGRIDLGNLNGIAKDITTWMRPTTGGTNALLLGGPTGVIGTFTATIPAYAGGSLDFLSYLPQIDPSGVANDWAWTENNTAGALISGTVTGSNPGTVITGSSVTFTAVPEPATWSLPVVVAGAGLLWRRRRVSLGG